MTTIEVMEAEEPLTVGVTNKLKIKFKYFEPNLFISLKVFNYHAKLIIQIQTPVQ